MVHRDIKPANIVLTLEGVIKVVDSESRASPKLQHANGTLLGTLGYMSPQQLRGQHADERADIWALGVVLYELLTGRRPFTGRMTPLSYSAFCRMIRFRRQHTRDLPYQLARSFTQSAVQG